MLPVVTAGPSIRRGDMYGGEEGKFSDVQQASGPTETGASPALWWIGGFLLLVFIRVAWEGADKG